MIDVTVSRDYNVPAARVWALLADFGNISWAPGMDKVKVEGSGVGMVRRIDMGDFEVVEKLESLDHATMRFSYSIPQMPMPVTDYRAGGHVVATGPDSCRVDWSCTATPTGISEQEATEMVKGLYAQLLGWVQDHFDRG